LGSSGGSGPWHRNENGIRDQLTNGYRRALWAYSIRALRGAANTELGTAVMSRLGLVSKIKFVTDQKSQMPKKAWQEDGDESAHSHTFHFLAQSRRSSGVCEHISRE
jgi:hypothetical protein